MHRLLRTTIIQLSLVVLLGQSTQAQSDGVWVEDKGLGVTEEAALRDAMRNALSQGAGSEISSHSQTDNFELVRDAIYARADGFVSQVKVLGYSNAVGGLKSCRIRAFVKKGDVAASWGGVQNVLDQVGRPGIMVYVKETIDGVLQEGSVLEAHIENRFTKMGFDLYARSQLKAIEQKEMADAVANNNVSKMQAIAKNFHTQIFISGYANTNTAGSRNLAGQSTAMYNADGLLKMYHTDTGKLITSEVLTNCRGGARTAYAGSHQGGRKALLNCAEELADRLYWSAMKSWSTQISAGGTLVLEVQGVSAVDAINIKRKLQDAVPDKIQSIHKSFSKGIATFRIQSTLSVDDLVIILSSGDLADFMTIEDQQMGKIQAVRTGK